MIYKNAFLSLGGTDLSAYLESVEPNFEVEMTDDTVMGDDARSNEPGLENWSFSARFKNPFAAGGPDATLWSLKGTTFAIIWRPDAGSASTSNPEYEGTGTWRSNNPIGGSVGDQGVMSIELVPGGSQPALTRSTS